MGLSPALPRREGEDYRRAGEWLFNLIIVYRLRCFIIGLLLGMLVVIAFSLPTGEGWGEAFLPTGEGRGEA